MGQTVPSISDLVILLPFEVFPPLRQPRGAQLRGAGRQPLLHEVDGRGRPGRLTGAALARATEGPGLSAAGRRGSEQEERARFDRVQ